MSTLPYSPAPAFPRARDPNLTVTTGLTDNMLFPHLDRPQPKALVKCGAERSDDNRKIPNLREPFKPDKKLAKFMKKIEKADGNNRGMRKYANSIVESIGMMI